MKSKGKGKGKEDRLNMKIKRIEGIPIRLQT